MVRFGLCTHEQYARRGPDRHLSTPHVAYRLLDVGERPSEEQVRAFEDISVLLRTSNGTFRTTFRQRFRDVDEAALRRMKETWSANEPIGIQDRAASHGLTSFEWAERIFDAFPQARFEASDILLELIEISRGDESYIVEPGGRAIQYVKSPFVVSLEHPEPKRYPVNRLVARAARRRFERLRLGERWMEEVQREGWKLRRIPYVHPRARQLGRANSNFRFALRNVFDAAPASCDVLRTMNIFNPGYFSESQLREGVQAALVSVRAGGIWILGRTLVEDLTNHASLLRRRESGWEVLERIGQGSEIEALALGARS